MNQQPIGNNNYPGVVHTYPPTIPDVLAEEIIRMKPSGKEVFNIDFDAEKDEITVKVSENQE